MHRFANHYNNIIDAIFFLVDLVKDYVWFLFIFHTVVMCPDLPSPPNADVQHPNGPEYQSTAVYTCDNGYERSSGNLERTCEADGTWSGSEPVCSGETLTLC